MCSVYVSSCLICCQHAVCKCKQSQLVLYCWRQYSIKAFLGSILTRNTRWTFTTTELVLWEHDSVAHYLSLLNGSWMSIESLTPPAVTIFSRSDSTKTLTLLFPFLSLSIGTSNPSKCSYCYSGTFLYLSVPEFLFSWLWYTPESLSKQVFSLKMSLTINKIRGNIFSIKVGEPWSIIELVWLTRIGC